MERLRGSSRRGRRRRFWRSASGDFSATSRLVDPAPSTTGWPTRKRPRPRSPARSIGSNSDAQEISAAVAFAQHRQQQQSAAISPPQQLRNDAWIASRRSTPPSRTSSRRRRRPRRTTRCARCASPTTSSAPTTRAANCSRCASRSLPARATRETAGGGRRAADAVPRARRRAAQRPLLRRHRRAGGPGRDAAALRLLPGLLLLPAVLRGGESRRDRGPLQAHARRKARVRRAGVSVLRPSFSARPFRRPLLGALETKHVDDGQYHAFLSCRTPL